MTTRMYHGQSKINSTGDILYYARILTIIMTICDTYIQNDHDEKYMIIVLKNVIDIIKIIRILLQQGAKSLIGIVDWNYDDNWSKANLICKKHSYKSRQYMWDKNCMNCQSILYLPYAKLSITKQEYDEINIKSCYIKKQYSHNAEEVRTHKIIIQLIQAITGIQYVKKMEKIIGKKLDYCVVAGLSHQFVSM